MPTSRVIGQPDLVGLREQIKENVAFALGGKRFHSGPYLQSSDVIITTSYSEPHYRALAHLPFHRESVVMAGQSKPTPVEALEDLMKMSSEVLGVLNEAKASREEQIPTAWMDVAVEFYASNNTSTRKGEQIAKMQQELVERALERGIIPTREAGMKAFLNSDR